MKESVTKSKSARLLVGKVVSDKMQKTVTVLIERRVKHPLYGKIVRKARKYHAHDSSFSAAEGDTVEIQETAPIAKTVSWRVSRIVEKAKLI